MHNATVIGAGLAGCEAAWALAQRGFGVRLIDMKPKGRTAAHSADTFAELVCSNSLRSNGLSNAVGLLKAEMRLFGSLTMDAAEVSRVPAGSALAVDRVKFSKYITERLIAHPNIHIACEEIEDLPEAPAIVATGPLTGGALAEAIGKIAKALSFFDAAAPIVSEESLDFSELFAASRYGKGDADYLNSAMDEERYFAFVRALAGAEQVSLRGFENKEVFEGCMPVETLARRGPMALAFGPLRPVGLRDPKTGNRPFAVVQLRREDLAGESYNLVGFQTNLKYGEQQRVFSMLPGLKNAEFLRYGVMHRNTFFKSPGFLGDDFQAIERPGLYFAGQITGVEGYVESAASGLLAGVQLARSLEGKEKLRLPGSTALGALARYISSYAGDYQPMHVNFGMIDPLDKRVKGKRARYEAVSERALEVLKEILNK